MCSATAECQLHRRQAAPHLFLMTLWSVSQLRWEDFSPLICLLLLSSSISSFLPLFLTSFVMPPHAFLAAPEDPKIRGKCENFDSMESKLFTFSHLKISEGWALKLRVAYNNTWRHGNAKTHMCACVCVCVMHFCLQ